MELLELHDPTMAANHVGVQVEAHHLNSVSKSVLMAESWLRNHVLSHYPSTNITTIVVGHILFCDEDERHKLGKLILPSIKNIHYSLTRWGLQNDIKVAPAFSPKCLDSVSENFSKPLVTILHQIGSPIVLSDEKLKFHSKSIENSGFKSSIMILNSEKNPKRKLSFIDISRSKLPFPPVFPPSHSSNPAYAAGTPLPPLIGTVAPPPSVSPSLPPESNPNPNPKSPPSLPHLATPPYGPHLPPCEPTHGGGAPAVGGHHHELWCVAKPSVPAETLQEALDYACGEGSADCEAIANEGSCHFPDTVVAHASYAFNSYWQRTKRNGGTCGFGGTAMLINSDPSKYLLIPFSKTTDTVSKFGVMLILCCKFGMIFDSYSCVFIVSEEK